jgi:hypothetical protein
MDPNLYSIYRANMNEVANGDTTVAEKQGNDYLNYVHGWNFHLASKEMTAFKAFLSTQKRTK